MSAAKQERRPAMEHTITIGMDLGDKFNVAVVFDSDGNELEISKVTNTKVSMAKFFSKYNGATVAIEAGTHSPWINRLLNEMGLTVYVGNPRRLRCIWDSKDKSDARDARMLGMICRMEPRLLYPLQHRGGQAQVDLAVVKSRDALVKSRTQLINHVRSVVKTNGDRLPKCSADYFAKRCKSEIPPELSSALGAVFKAIEALTEQIHQLGGEITEMSKEKYPETSRLQQIPGVGPITALSFILHIDDASRFSKSRQVGAFIGLTPRRDQSGDTDKQLRITKAGSKYLRQLLVSCAQYIIGPFGPDSDLRRHGMTICARGGKNAKKRAVVAVARKLAVLLHRLWVTDDTYNPFHNSLKKKAA
mgnify:CR=1 FL=1